MPTTTNEHVHLDGEGRAWIDDTHTKVVEVVLDKLAYGWSPEEIHFQHPHLSLAQIHAALAYYYDHRVDLDAEVEGQLERVKAGRAEADETPLQKRLRAAGKLR